MLLNILVDFYTSTGVCSDYDTTDDFFSKKYESSSFITRYIRNFNLDL